MSKRREHHYTGLIERYRERLPVSDDTPVISLNEGNTPLIALEQSGERARADVRLYAKFEGSNPTGSFKDRGMTVAVSKAVESGAGRSSAPQRATPRRRPRRTRRAPASRVRVDPGRQDRLGQACPGDDARCSRDSDTRQFRHRHAARQGGRRRRARDHRQLDQSLSAARAEDGRLRDRRCARQRPRLPLSAGWQRGQHLGYWMGYSSTSPTALPTETPQMCGYQASGAAPFVRGEPVERPETIATAIRIGQPAILG